MSEMHDTDILTRDETKLDFVPVIFANGEDDDLPGIVAAVLDQRVQFEEKIYKPGEDVVLYKEVLRLNCKWLIVLGPDDEIPEQADEAGSVVVRVTGLGVGRELTIDRCFIKMGGDGGMFANGKIYGR